MIEIRWHGRAGQGAKTAAHILAQSAIREGKYAQSFPEFGPERRGAPVQAFNRIAEEPFTIHSGVTEPDIVIILDPRLVTTVPVTDGLKAGGWIFLNSPVRAAEAQKAYGWEPFRLVTCAASAISRETLGRDIPNVPLLGALAARTGVVSLESLQTETAARLGKGRRRDEGPVQDNLRALLRGFEETDLALPKVEVLAGEKKTLSLLTYDQLPTGGLIERGGTAHAYLTGGWRLRRPELDLEKCVHCLMCWLVCPDSAILLSRLKVVGIDYLHCKGCGLCASQCPPRARALRMVDEEAFFPVEKVS